MEKEELMQVADYFYNRLEKEGRLPPIQPEYGRKPKWLEDYTQLNRATINAIARTVLKMQDVNNKLYERRILSIEQVAEKLNVSISHLYKIYHHLGGLKTGKAKSSPVIFLEDGKLIDRYLEYIRLKSGLIKE